MPFRPVKPVCKGNGLTSCGWAVKVGKAFILFNDEKEALEYAWSHRHSKDDLEVHKVYKPSVNHEIKLIKVRV